MTYSHLSPNHKTFLPNLNATSIPKNFSEALSDENWKDAMKMEMAFLEKNQTWELVNLLKGKRPVM